MRDDFSELTASFFDQSPERPAPGDEEALVAVLAERIAEMLEREPEQLMSMLYRLDVEERKIRPVMHPAAPEPAHVGLARLVLERQRQRLETKKNFKTPPLEGLEDWAW